MRRRILAVLAAHPEGLHVTAIAQQLGYGGDLGPTLRGMLRDEHVRRVGLGVAACEQYGSGLQTRAVVGQRSVRIRAPSGQRSVHTSHHSGANSLPTRLRAKTPCEWDTHWNSTPQPAGACWQPAVSKCNERVHR
jgi:hypothetical protein